MKWFCIKMLDRLVVAYVKRRFLGECVVSGGIVKYSPLPTYRKIGETSYI